MSNELAKAVLRNAVLNAAQTIPLDELKEVVNNSLKEIDSIVKQCFKEFATKRNEHVLDAKQYIGFDLGKEDSCVKATFKKQADGSNKVTILEYLK